MKLGDIETLNTDPSWNEYIKWSKQNKLMLYYCK